MMLIFNFSLLRRKCRRKSPCSRFFSCCRRRAAASKRRISSFPVQQQRQRPRRQHQRQPRQPAPACILVDATFACLATVPTTMPTTTTASTTVATTTTTACTCMYTCRLLICSKFCMRARECFQSTLKQFENSLKQKLKISQMLQNITHLRSVEDSI